MDEKRRALIRCLQVANEHQREEIIVKLHRNIRANAIVKARQAGATQEEIAAYTQIARPTVARLLGRYGTEDKREKLDNLAGFCEALLDLLKANPQKGLLEYGDLIAEVEKIENTLKKA